MPASTNNITASIGSLSKRFPFSIYYKLSEGCVEVYAVLDARQDPQKIDTALGSPRLGP